MTKISTVIESGSYYGFPEEFGDATITLVDEEPVSIVFANGVREMRHYHQNLTVTRVIMSADGSVEVITN